MVDMDSKSGSFKTVSHKDLLTINYNESVFFGSKMDQTKCKPLRMTDFLGLLWEIVAYIWNIFFKKQINTKNRILFCKSNNQVKHTSQTAFLGC